MSAEQLDLIATPATETPATLIDRITQTPEYANPCVRMFGKGPEGETCKHCAKLYRNHRQRTYIKCSLRKHTNGPGSDHKASWAACAKFQPKEGKAL